MGLIDLNLGEKVYPVFKSILTYLQGTFPISSKALTALQGALCKSQ